MAPKDNRETNAPRNKIRIRCLTNGEFMAYSWMGYYVRYGATMQDAHASYCRFVCELN